MVSHQCDTGRSAPRHSRKAARALALLLLASIATPASPEATAPDAIPAPALVRATPALWQVSDADTTIYLFGTFHTLDGRTAWLDNRVRQAFEGSDELMLETVVPADRFAMQAAADGQVTEVSADGSRKLKPYFAGTRNVLSKGRELGFSVDNGADAVLRRLAEDAGKPVSGLERFEDQLGQLARIPAPESEQSAAPAITVTLNDLFSAWTTGDTGAFSTMLQGFEAKSPIAYRMLIADRNARWGQWIADRLEKPGRVFVAVGTGHLAGKDSVQQWLSARGIEATRVG
jgi:uncharacterized protein YbaP (TraB family)